MTILDIAQIIFITAVVIIGLGFFIKVAIIDEKKND
ncbi:MAG: cellulose biosynthesis protein BcsF [Campylobacter sp.]|nr:cellulose biosynthesis protein BcsF [Campylobacter sp.]